MAIPESEWSTWM